MFEHEYYCPEDIKAAIDDYVANHTQHGHFVTAVLENNLTEAIAHADQCGLRNLPAIVRYCYNHIPGRCWGSPDKVKAWLKKGGDPVA